MISIAHQSLTGNSVKCQSRLITSVNLEHSIITTMLGSRPLTLPTRAALNTLLFQLLPGYLAQLLFTLPTLWRQMFVAASQKKKANAGSPWSQSERARERERGGRMSVKQARRMQSRKLPEWITATGMQQAGAERQRAEKRIGTRRRRRGSRGCRRQSWWRTSEER